jgi:hypothetical protein
MKLSKKHTTRNSRIPVAEYLLNTKSAQEDEYIHVVSIPWQGQKEYWWNETCTDILEVFGLPGDRFTSHPSENKMDFYFKTEKDAQLCKILVSEKI